MKLTRQQGEDLLIQLRHNQDAALRGAGRGSYKVVLNNTKTTHMDFSDLPFLGARTPSESDTRARVLAVVRSWTLAFFDETLRGGKAPVLVSKPPTELIDSVERFPPAKRAW